MPDSQNEAGAPASLTRADVLKVAQLARLAIPDDQVDAYRDKLAAVITYADRLRGLDLTNVEPMSSPMDAFASPRDDEPGPTISNEALMRLAPDSMPPFIKVPKVLGDGGGA